MTDSRLKQMIALLDDARSVGMDVVEDPPSQAFADELRRVCIRVGDQMREVQKLHAALDMPCNRSALGGGRCSREPFHAGKHRLTMPSGAVFEWTDQSQDELLRRTGGTRGT